MVVELDAEIQLIACSHGSVLMMEAVTVQGLGLSQVDRVVVVVGGIQGLVQIIVGYDDGTILVAIVKDDTI